MSDTHQSRLPDPVALTIAITNCGSQDPCTDSVIGAHVHTLSERLSVPTVAVMSSAYRERLNITEEEDISHLAPRKHTDVGRGLLVCRALTMPFI